MADSLFDQAVVPVASDQDAQRTCEALLPHLDPAENKVHLAHVIEYTEDYLDTTSPEQLEQDVEVIFETARDTLSAAGFTSYETHLYYGTDVVDTIYDACEELDATGVVFVSRHASRWKRLLTGDVALSLITENPYPAIVLPDPEAESDEDT